MKCWARFSPVPGQPDVWELRAYDCDGPAGWFRNASDEQIALYLDPDRYRFLPCSDPRLGEYFRIVDGRPVSLDP